MVETSEINLDRGVINPSHPPIIGVVEMATSSSALKAGTILKLSSGKYSLYKGEYILSSQDQLGIGTEDRSQKEYACTRD